MKAASAVLIHIQQQQTVLGLTPLLFVATLFGTWAITLPVFDLLPEVAIPVGVVAAFSIWFYFWRQLRKNPFFERELTVAIRFWRGKRERNLVAGNK